MGIKEFWCTSFLPIFLLQDTNTRLPTPMAFMEHCFHSISTFSVSMVAVRKQHSEFSENSPPRDCTKKEKQKQSALSRPILTNVNSIRTVFSLVSPGKSVDLLSSQLWESLQYTDFCRLSHIKLC